MKAADACGCYGPCSLPPTLPCQGPPGSTNPSSCICDCCPACQRIDLYLYSCDQLFAGCNRDIFQYDLILSPPIPISVTSGSVVSAELLRNGTGQVNYFIGACVQPALPDGLSLALDNSTGFVTLEGTPSISSPQATYTVIAKGGVNYIGTLNFTLSIV
ncbi:hypothetical protein NQZ79_g4815 [Umbelopsis isabellina]|nr:hypothetical protein NQZ79_g4815 [Umbelopsis isabellina]